MPASTVFWIVFPPAALILLTIVFYIRTRGRRQRMSPVLLGFIGYLVAVVVVSLLTKPPRVVAIDEGSVRSTP